MASAVVEKRQLRGSRFAEVVLDAIHRPRAAPTDVDRAGAGGEPGMHAPVADHPGPERQK